MSLTMLKGRQEPIRGLTVMLAAAMVVANLAALHAIAGAYYL